MKLLVCFLIFLACLALSHQRLPMGNCDQDPYFFEFINSEIGWVGIGAVNLGSRDRLDNITVSVKLETVNLADKSYLGEIRLLHFGTQRADLSYTKYSIFFEFRFPVDNPLPNIINISVDGWTLCENSVESDDSLKIHLGYIYNSFTKVERKFAEIVDIPSGKIEVTPEPEKKKEEPVVENKADENIECGTIGNVDTIRPLIIDGQTYPRGAWPWLVSIYSYFGPKLGFQCGGTLVSKKLVVSAAHCFFDGYNRKIAIQDIIIILGQYNLKRPQDKGTQIIYPDKIHTHPNYQIRNNVDADIAVVVFADKATFSNFIRPACLWSGSADKRDIVGLKGTTAGWGRDENGNFFTDLPKKVDIPVVSDEICLRSHEIFSKITSTNTFCAGWRNGTEGPCNGDSGGGLIFDVNGKWNLRGLVSTALSDRKTSACDQNEYVIFTDIVPFIDWIKSFSDSTDSL
ncbi:hypothetical protein DMENIID0001_072800 [Sergentomyia squamirostris]